MSGEYDVGNPTAVTPVVPAAWYPDPEFAGQLRYWDGTRWTPHRHSVPPTAAPPTSAPPTSAPPTAAPQAPPASAAPTAVLPQATPAPVAVPVAATPYPAGPAVGVPAVAGPAAAVALAPSNGSHHGRTSETPPDHGSHRGAQSKGSRTGLVIAAAVALALVAGIGAVALKSSGDGSPSSAASPAPGATDVASPTPSGSSPPTPSTTSPPTPSPTPPPKPATTPAPLPSPKPTSIAIQPYENQTFAGTGRKVLRLTRVVGPVLITMRHTGLSNYAVWAVNSGGRKTDLLANTIGNYAGTRIAGATDEDVAALAVDADGKWSIAIRPVSTAPLWKGSKVSGRGDVVLRTGGVAGLVTVRANYTGTGNFAVWAYDDSRRSLVFNEIDKFQGESLLPDGTVVIAVESDGPWTLVRS